MAVVKELVTKGGVRIIIRDDLMEKDQTKAWEQAKATATAIYFAQKAKSDRCALETQRSR